MAFAARLILGIVFLSSGALKLRDPSWLLTARKFGAPTFVAVAVGPTEILLGAMLVVGVASPWPSIAAEVILAVFTVAMLRAMRKPLDERPVCACFGRWAARPVGSSSIARNLILLALAAISTGV